MSDTTASRLTRWCRLLALGGRLAVARIRQGDRRLVCAVALVAVAVGLLVTLTGISMGLADPFGQSTTADYWLLPAGGGELTAAFAVDGPAVGDVHDRSENLQAREDVTAATPVLTDVIRVQSSGSSQPTEIIAVGVIPPEQPTTVSGVSTTTLDSGDPYYGDGAYDGEWTGEVVLSPAAAETLDASPGDQLTFGSTTTGQLRQGFEVISVEAAEPSAESLPIAVVRLSELQSLTGDDGADQADSILLQTTSSADTEALSESDDTTRLVADSAVGADRLVSDDQALGLAVAALLVGFVSAVLQTATAVGLDVEATTDELLALAAIGLAPASRLLVTGATAVWLSTLGGIVGVGLGWGALSVLNTDLAATIGTPPPVVQELWLVPYGIGIAIAAGLCAALYPVVLVNRLETASGGIQWR